MTKTVELLKQMKDALLSDALKPEEINIEDIKQATRAELQLYQLAFKKEKYFEMLTSYENIGIFVKPGDLRSVLVVLEASIMVLNSIPEVSFYFTKDFWEKRHGGLDSEKLEIVDYIIQKQDIGVFNYPFTSQYSKMDVTVYSDEKAGCRYVLYKGKRMYFPESWKAERIVEYCRGIFMEQDGNSPHCYNNKKYLVKEGDVVIDAGVAEGNFALDVIDRVKKIYLVEADWEWVNALRLTFNDYMDKVVIVQKYLDEKSFDDHISLKDVTNEKVDYIKMDIEGFEVPALLGAEKMLFETENITMAVCSYHNSGDEEKIMECLKKSGFETETSKGYMFPNWNYGTLYEAELRRGLVFARK